MVSATEECGCAEFRSALREPIPTSFFVNTTIIVRLSLFESILLRKHVSLIKCLHHWYADWVLILSYLTKYAASLLDNVHRSQCSSTKHSFTESHLTVFHLGPIWTRWPFIEHSWFRQDSGMGPPFQRWEGYSLSYWLYEHSWFD